MKLKVLLLFLVMAITCGCSDKYDDSNLWQTVNELKGRVDALETVQRALQNKLTIESVIDTTDGYRIVFSDGTMANIINDKPIEIPEDKDTCYISSIVVGDNDVSFYLTDGSSFSIEYYYCPLNHKESSPTS